MQIKGLALVILLSGLGTAFAMAVSGRDDAPSEVVGAVDKHAIYGLDSSGQRERAQDAIRYDLSAIKRTVPDKIQDSKLFQATTWYTPPPTAPVSMLPPPPPSAPPLPFTFIGRMMDGKDVILFLSGNGHQYTVKANDVLDDTYRVDKITDNDAVLTYLPMNTPQTLAFNSSAMGSTATNKVTASSLQHP